MAAKSEVLKWPPLITKRTCEWCSSPCWMKDEFPRLCQHPWSQWPTDLLLDLQYCEDCVMEYHRIRDDFVSIEPLKKKDLWKGDVQRLTLFIRQALQLSHQEGEGLGHSTLEVLDHFEKNQLCIDHVVQNLNVPLLEILQFPQLLFDRSLAELFVNALSLLIDSGTPPILLEKYPGIYVLLVHPSQKVRKFSNKSVKRLSRVSSDDYDTIKDAIQWMVGVVTLNMFDNDILLIETLDVFSPAVYLPSHLCDLKCPLEFWKGFMMLLLRLEGDVLCYKVLGVSGYRDLPDTILNAIENKDSKSLFWSAFTCLAIILERCGPRIWPMVTKQPLQVFNLITSHSAYCEELDRYKQSGLDNSRLSDEQTEQNGSQDNTYDAQRSSNKTICWFQPFVLSVLDYGEVTVDCVTEVITYLHKLSGQTRKMEIVSKLCNIVYRVLHSGRMSSLLPSAEMWMIHVVNLSSFDVKNHDQEGLHTIAQSAQGIIVELLTKTEDRAGQKDLKSFDFRKLKSERERQNLVTRLLNNLKETSKTPVRCKKEPCLHTKTAKRASYLRKSENSLILASPQTTSEAGTQTIRYRKELCHLHKKTAKKSYELKALKVIIPDCKRAKLVVGSTKSNVAVTSSSIPPNSLPTRAVTVTASTTNTLRASTSSSSGTGTVADSRSRKSASPSLSFRNTKLKIQSPTFFTSTTTPSPTSDDNVAFSTPPVTPTVSTFSSSPTATSKIDRTDTPRSSSETKVRVLDKNLTKSSISLENENASPKNLLNDDGSSKSNPISLDSDEEKDELGTEEIEGGKNAFEENKNTKLFKQEKQKDSNNSPRSPAQLSGTPENTTFSIFKNRSQEKSVKRLHGLRKTEDSQDSLRRDAIVSKDSRKNISSRSTRSSSIELNISSTLSNLTVDRKSSSSSSKDSISSSDVSRDPVRLIKESNYRKTDSTLRKRSQLMNYDSSDETISLEESDDDTDEIYRIKLDKRFKKKIQSVKKNITKDLESSDTESLEEPVSLVKGLPSSESELDSDEPLENIRTPRKKLRTMSVSSETPKNNTLEGYDQGTVIDGKTLPSGEAPKNSIDIPRLRKNIYNLKEILKDPKNKNKTFKYSWFTQDAPKITEKSRRVNPLEAEPTLSALDDLKLESQNCTDDEVPRILEVRQLDTFPSEKSEFVKFARGKDADEASSEILTIKQETGACSDAKMAPGHKLTYNKLTPVKTESGKDTVLGNNAEFNDENCDEVLLLLSEEEKNSQDEDPLLEDMERVGFESEGGFSDEDLFAAYEEKRLYIEKNENEEEQPCPTLVIKDEGATSEELTDEKSFTACNTEQLSSYGEKINSEVLPSAVNIEEDVEDREKNQDLVATHSLEKSKDFEEEKNDVEEELCSELTNREEAENSKDLNEDFLPLRAHEGGDDLRAESRTQVGQESTDSVRCVESINTETGDTYADISSDPKPVELIGTVEEQHAEDGIDVKEKLFEDLDDQSLWGYDDWDDTNAFCSQESVIDAIEADEESVSSDGEQTNETQDPFRSLKGVESIANFDANSLASDVRIPVTQATVFKPPLPPLAPLRPMLPPAPENEPKSSKDPFQEKPAIVGQEPIFRPDAMIEMILSWHVWWLDARREEIKIYSNIDRTEKLPKTFDSMASYCRSFAPILAVEAWEQAIKEYRECNNRIITSLVRNTNLSHKYVLITSTTANVGQLALTNRTLPEESELVILQCDGFKIFGAVDKVEQEVVRGRGSSSGGDNGFNERTFNVTFTIRALRKTNFRPPDSSMLEITVVASLLTTLRRWCALVCFHQSLLARDILRPRNKAYFCYGEIPNQVKPSKLYNESQAKVIQTAAEAVHQAYTLPRICLVQGPPGTGKSHTIVGIVSSILNHPKAQETSQVTSELFPDKPKILICAPSNEAVDELIRKFIQSNPKRVNMKSNQKNRSASERERNPTGEGFINCGDFCLVRMGRKSKIGESVKSMTLDNIVRREMDKRNSRTEVSTAYHIKDQLKLLDKIIDSMERKRYILMKEETATAAEENLKESQLQELESEKSSLIAQKKNLERSYYLQREKEFRSKRIEARIRKDVLNSADIICTTLSGSGSKSLLNDMRGTNGKKIPFTCVIVDEACQCCELDVLIPLQYRPTKLILVGDPEQLSATVISRDAKHLLYGRSMFDRLFRVFKPLRRNERPVHLLSIQYRMHPEIALFPSKQFYNENIHTDGSLVQRAFPVKFPYALFDVYRGRENNDNGGSISNPLEVKLVSSICHHLITALRLRTSDIGIITPYRTQRSRIQAQLSDGFCRDIEVKTVDGFQGGEKNVIIMSCVRTGGSIGFLDDPNRLNVALTRARHALFVFGHMDTLKKFKGWHEMHKDADDRKLVFRVETVEDVIRVVSTATPRPTSVPHPVHHANHHSIGSTSSGISVNTSQNKETRPNKRVTRWMSLEESRPPLSWEPSSKDPRIQSSREPPAVSGEMTSTKYTAQDLLGNTDKDDGLANETVGTYEIRCMEDVGRGVKSNIDVGIESSMAGNDNRMENDDADHYTIAKADNGNDHGERTARSSRVDDNQSGHQGSLFDRLKHKVIDHSGKRCELTVNSRSLRDHKSPSPNNCLENTNSTKKPLKSNLKRPFDDKDTGSSKPAKRLRFGWVEVNTLGICRSYPIPDEDKRASPKHLQKSRDYAKEGRLGLGGLGTKNSGKTGNRAKNTARHDEKGSIHSGKDHATGAVSTHSDNTQTNSGETSTGLGKDRRGVDRDDVNTKVSSRHKEKVPSHRTETDGRHASSRIDAVNQNQINSRSFSLRYRQTIHERQLDEAVSRVQGAQHVQRATIPYETPGESRGGRGGRLRVPSYVPEETSITASFEPSASVRNWKPHGGARSRTAQSDSTSVQHMRLRAVHHPEVEGTRHRGQKRTLPRLEDICFQKKRRK